jgi:hypothetical protein
MPPLWSQVNDPDHLVRQAPRLQSRRTFKYKNNNLLIIYKVILQINLCFSTHKNIYSIYLNGANIVDDDLTVLY